MTRQVKEQTVQFLLRVRERLEFNGLAPHLAHTAMLVVAEELAVRAARNGQRNDAIEILEGLLRATARAAA